MTLSKSKHLQILYSNLAGKDQKLKKIFFPQSTELKLLIIQNTP